MDTILYFDCFSGISGDMIVGALLDLGVEEEYLRQHLADLKLNGYSIQIQKKQKMGIRGTDFRVQLMESCHHAPHRGFLEIESIINESSLKKSIKTRSIDIFRRIAEAEAHVHGMNFEGVHFHEVGALDSIVDVTAALICMEALDIKHVYASPLHLGEGFVRCAHGLLPVPAPAVLEILQGVPVYTTGLKSELVTPTGAAIISNLAEHFGPFPEMVPESVGYGLGDRELEIPNLLRVVKAQTTSKEQLWELECNIDDMNPQYYSYLFPFLMERGALDVFLTPIIMKKSRPGICLSLLCRENHIEDLEEILWQETTTLGIRRMQVQRRVLERSIVSIPTKWGIVSVKMAYHKGRLLKFASEYEELARIAREYNLPLPEVQREVQIAAEKWLSEHGALRNYG